MVQLFYEMKLDTTNIFWLYIAFGTCRSVEQSASGKSRETHLLTLEQRTLIKLTFQHVLYCYHGTKVKPICLCHQFLVLVLWVNTDGCVWVESINHVLQHHLFSFHLSFLRRQSLTTQSGKMTQSHSFTE